MSNFSPQDLNHAQVKACSKALAIMVYRFIPVDSNLYYSAQEISHQLTDLSNGRLSTLYVEADTLKIALANKRLRDGLIYMFPGKFLFNRSCSHLDIIVGLFQKGQQLKLLSPVCGVDISDCFRSEIESLKLALISYYDAEDPKISSSKKASAVEESFKSPESVKLTLFTPSLIGETSMSVDTDSNKRGRPIVTADEINSKLRSLRKQLKRYHDKTPNQLSLNYERDNDRFDTIGERVISLIKEAGCYTEKINGEECVSIVSGLLLQDLISNCGCSVEKLPLIIGIITTMLFGKLHDDVYSKIVKSHNTYALASERTALVVVLEVRQRFTDREAENRILYAYLILDASNKKNKGCVGKVAFIVGFDGVVRQIALRLDTTVTKKAVGSSKITIESLENELGDGLVWIMGITTDAFGAAVEEAVLVLRHIDSRAEKLTITQQNLLHRPSLVIPGQVYKYGGRFRESCVRTCVMHNFERILASMINILMGNQGLSYDMTTSQNLFRLNYYTIKYRSMVDALTVKSVGGNPEDFSNAPDAIRKLIGSVNATRWLSTERTSDNLLETMSVPASPDLVEHVCKFFGGPESENWVIAKKFCTCIDSTDLSHTMLSFWYLANHSPGGKKGEGAIGCLRVLGFLGSPYHRITIKIVASLYPIHLSWAAFADKNSEIGVRPKCPSTRSVEAVRFDRGFLQAMSQLAGQWEKFLPDSKAFLDSEAQRAEDLELVSNKDEVTAYFNDLMSKGTCNVLKMALKYFFYPGLRPGWSILQVVDPFVGPKAAGAILSALTILGNIAPEDIPAPVAHVDNPVVADDNGSDIDESDIDDDDDDVYNDSGQINGIMMTDVEWTIESTTHAAPTVLMSEYEKIITDGFLDAPREVIQGIVQAYGLGHRRIIAELKMIANGELKIQLDERIDNWRSHSHVNDEYWDLFREVFPALADTITVNFQARSITGTPVEQTFCLAATQIRANQTASTNAKNMNHASTVKGSITREMRSFEEANDSTKRRIRKHIFRGFTNQNVYVHSVFDYGLTIREIVAENSEVKVATVLEMRHKGKKVMELQQSLPHTEAEMLANAPRNVVKADGMILLQAIKDATESKKNSWDNMPLPEIDIFEDAAKKMSVTALKKLLRTYYFDDKVKCTQINKMLRGDRFDAPDTLLGLTVSYWKLHFDAPPEIVHITLTPLQKRILNTSSEKLKEELRELYAGDAEKCLTIAKALKGKFDSPTSLVSMLYEVSKSSECP